MLYLPGRGGNLRLAVRTANSAYWLHEAADIETRYRPGELLYTIKDPAFGAGVVRVVERGAAYPARGSAPGHSYRWPPSSYDSEGTYARSPQSHASANGQRRAARVTGPEAPGNVTRSVVIAASFSATTAASA